ncbi:acyl carrier protein [Xinfangfangia sp. D13-10-4-6]|uniref:acyl carrier protein n=1 Tax=Pseudogemmobacter hezensis TaxID=2737662 RepID=UPI0015539BB0|nr:acyl carrier protein [Pseudogemmobacter hezensis]NPD13629.1 acyl carrier protein [Pseudogemmobacter hezensis]
MSLTDPVPDIAAEVTAILAAQALVDPSQVDPGQTLDQLGLDSLGLVEAVFAIEERFDISVPFNPNDPGAAGPDDLDVSDVAGIIRGVEVLVAAKQAANQAVR